MNFLPLIAIGALIYAATRQGVKKAIEKISVSLKQIKPGLPPKIVLEFLNPTPLKVEITFIKISVTYKGVEVATLSDTNTRVINPGSNDIELTLRPSIQAISLLNVTKGTPRTIGVTWEIGTKLYSITGEKQTTL
jgi:hypothetical protein